ncbi:hypothetical protein [Cryobacterium sp. Y11]|uniref:hypothetical protein n=1 Tax=Cryobacterium sp. Y11 TaxID=2045016 RepID=UPI0011B04309|nr:hypothetical protein [Cryobacterium sp. Y11]
MPANKLNRVDRARTLDLVNSSNFVDLPPIQIYAQLLDQGGHLASISTIYRILTENKQVKERRRLARHPPPGTGDPRIGRDGTWSRAQLLCRCRHKS